MALLDNNQSIERKPSSQGSLRPWEKWLHRCVRLAERLMIPVRHKKVHEKQEHTCQEAMIASTGFGATANEAEISDDLLRMNMKKLKINVTL